uniref:Putative secreted protein n=1 Tax=Rhipicephalus microplus TaxID=6941 RepID=A0A6G5A279_RHIMP
MCHWVLLDSMFCALRARVLGRRYQKCANCCDAIKQQISLSKTGTTPLVVEIEKTDENSKCFSCLGKQMAEQSELCIFVCWQTSSIICLGQTWSG